MDKNEVITKVYGIVAGVCETTPDKIDGHTAIGDFPRWDSVGQLTILNKVEEAFDINFEPEEMMDIEDVNDIVEAVAAKL